MLREDKPTPRADIAARLRKALVEIDEKPPPEYANPYAYNLGYLKSFVWNAIAALEGKNETERQEISDAFSEASKQRLQEASKRAAEEVR